MKKKLFIILWLIISVSICTLSFASMYIWTDENGIKHYSNNKPPTGGKDYKEETELVTIEKMKKPKNGSCDEFYMLIEGVCVHQSAALEDANEMKAVIQDFKDKKRRHRRRASSTRTRNYSSSPRTTTSSSKDDSLCEKYRKRLAKYQREGVMGINPSTGKLSKMTGSAAAQAIQNVKDNVEIFCD